MSNIYKLSDAPEDYKQLWMDMLSDSFPDIDIDTDLVELECTLLPVANFREEFVDQVNRWSEYDLVKAVGFTQYEVLDNVPPLVHTDGFLNDGYHRVAACYWTGVEYMLCVNFSDVVRKLSKAEAQRVSQESEVVDG